MECGGNYIKSNSERQKYKNKTNRIGDMKDRVKRSNICLNSRKRENRDAAIFEEIMAEIFSESVKDTRPQIEKPSKSQEE